MAAITKPLNEINARKFIDVARKGCYISYDRFPQEQLADYRNTPIQEMLDKFGKQYADYLNCTLQMAKIRNACEIVSRKLDVSDPIRQWSRDLAAQSMGCGYPMELTSKVFLQTFARNRPVVRLSIYSSVAENVNHSFLISGDIDHITKSCTSGGNKLTDLLNKLRNCTILDPFVNSFCRVENFESSATNQYLQSIGADSIANPEFIKPSSEALAQYGYISKVANNIVNEASRILDNPINTNERIERLRYLVLNANARFEPASRRIFSI